MTWKLLIANEDIVDEDETNGVLELLKKHDENLFQIVSLLSVELTKPFKFSRNAAQLYLEKISQKVGLSILRLLKPFKARLRKYVLTRSLRSVMGFEQLARMNTAIFLLSLPTGPLFKVDHHMTQFLLQSIGLSTREKNLPPFLPINLDAGSFSAATPSTRKILGLDGDPIDVIDDHDYPFTGTYVVQLRTVTIGLIWACVVASPSYYQATTI